MTKTLKNSLLGGFDKAFSTIVDANVTTLITAFILIYFGTGPVKGFGVTLAIGIGSTMFCALIVSRVFLDLLINTELVKRMLTFSLFKEKASLDFLNYRKYAFLCSWIIVLIAAVEKDRGNEIVTLLQSQSNESFVFDTHINGWIMRNA